MSEQLLGEIVVIKRNGSDGARFPLRLKQCTFGRDPECDIRIQIPQVEEEHAKIYFDNGKVWLQNLSSEYPTLLNSKRVDLQEVNHNDLFTITQRSFRFEFPEGRKPRTPRRSSTKTPLKALQGSPRTPSAGESLKTSISKLRRNSSTVLEENEAALSASISRENSTKWNKIKEKENTPEDVGTPSILKRKDSAKGPEKKRISFGPTLSPEFFDKSLPPSTPLRKGRSPGRRLSEPLKSVNPGASSKKRCSLAAGLGKIPIMEEEEEEEARIVDFCETPPADLPAPLQPAPLEPARVINGAEDSNAKKTDEPACEANEDTVADEEDSLMENVQQGTAIKERKLATPTKRQIHSGIAFCKSKKIATPLRKDIERKPTLKKTKQKLATPVRESIQKGVLLQATKKKLQTPLRKDIQKGTKLRQTKPKLPTPLRDEIKSKPTLRATKRKMRRSLQDEIVKGKQLNSKFASVKKAPEELLEEIRKGTELKKVLRSAPTPLRAEIKNGVKLRETKRNMRKSLKNEIIRGKNLRKTKLSAPTPLRKAIKEGKKLRKTKKTAPTPLREAIKQGVTLRKTKKTLDKDLQAEIKEGKHLKKTKISAPTPLRNEIKTGVRLRKTKKKLDANLQQEIQIGKELRKTMKSAPTPFKNEIKRGKKLRVTKKVMRESLQNEIKAGVNLAPQLKKALKTPIRNQIKAGVKLRKKKTDTVCVAGRETEESMSGVFSSDDGTEHEALALFEEEAETEENDSVPESNYGQHEKNRPILRATRKMSKKIEAVAVMAEEIPRRMSAKTEKPAKKRVCRRSTPKKIVELRENLQTNGKKDHDVSATDSDNLGLLSPIITFPTSEAKTVLCETPKYQHSDLYVSETSFEDPPVTANFPGIGERFDAIDKVCKNPTSSDSHDTSMLLGLKQLMKTPKARIEDDALEGLKHLMKTPNAGKLDMQEVQNNLGLKRLMKTPKDKTKQGVEENLGLKRLMKTPKVKTRQEGIEENLGLQRLMKTPKVKSAEPVEETVELAGLFNTPKENFQESPEVNSELGLKRLLKTPKTKGDAVEEHLGLKRLMKTPKQRGDLSEVQGHLGLNRLMQSPKEKTNETMEIDGDLGLQRLMRSSKVKNPSVNSPHLGGLFSDMREKRTKETEVTEKFGLKRLLATPKDESQKTAPKYSLDAGALPSMFHLRKEKEQPIEDLQLQGMFVETEYCDPESIAIKSNQVTSEITAVDAFVLEEESTVGTRRRGKKRVTEEAPKAISTRSTRRNKAVPCTVIEDDAEDCGQQLCAEKNSGTSDTLATIEDVETNERDEEKLIDGQAGCSKISSNDPANKSMTGESHDVNGQRESVRDIEAEASEMGQKRQTRRQTASSEPQPGDLCKAAERKEMKAQPPTKRRKTRAMAREQDSPIDLEAGEFESTDITQKEEIQAAINSNDASSDVSGSRRSRRKPQGVIAKNASVGGRRTTRSAKTADVAIPSVVVMLDEISSEDAKGDEGLANENTRPSRSRTKRKSIEQGGGNTSSRMSRNVASGRSMPGDSQRELTASKLPMSGQNGTGSLDQKGEANNDAGLAKGMVKTPPKVVFVKTGLCPIQEETESPIATPMATVIDATSSESSVPAVTRSRRSRRRDFLAEKEAEQKAKQSNKEEQDDTGAGSSEKSDGSISAEASIPKASYRKTRSRQACTDAEIIETSQCEKRKRPTRSAKKQEPAAEDVSSEKRGSTAKKQKQTEVTERFTRSSARLRVR